MIAQPYYPGILQGIALSFDYDMPVSEAKDILDEAIGWFDAVNKAKSRAAIGWYRNNFPEGDVTLP